jgi:hypothetical protein
MQIYASGTCMGNVKHKPEGFSMSKNSSSSDDLFIGSPQIDYYEKKHKMTDFDDMYL